MAYAKRDDLVDAFGEDEVTELESDGTSAETMIANAASEVDSYIASRYAVPVAPVPVILKDAVLDIARFRWWNQRASEAVKDRYEKRIAWLRDVAAGKALLPGASASDEDGAASIPGHSPVVSGQGKSNFHWSRVM